MGLRAVALEAAPAVSCSVPPKSSHSLTLLRPMFAWAPIAQGLMRARLVVPANPRGDLVVLPWNQAT